MVWVALSLGSNDRPREHFSTCLDMLLMQFQDLTLSSVFESEALGKPGVRYLNMAVAFETDLPLAELVKAMKKLEAKHGRQRGAEAQGRVSLDIDVLVYGEAAGVVDGITLPHRDLCQAAYMLWPLSQIAGKRQHPLLKQSYKELWKAFDRSQQAIKPVPYEWHGRKLTVV